MKGRNATHSKRLWEAGGVKAWVKEHALQGNVEIVGVCHGLCSLALVSQGAGGACNVGLRCMFLAVTDKAGKSARKKKTNEQRVSTNQTWKREAGVHTVRERYTPHDIAKPLLSVLECESPREHEGLDAVPLELCARLQRYTATGWAG